MVDEVLLLWSFNYKTVNRVVIMKNARLVLHLCDRVRYVTRGLLEKIRNHITPNSSKSRYFCNIILAYYNIDTFSSLAVL